MKEQLSQLREQLSVVFPILAKSEPEEDTVGPTVFQISGNTRCFSESLFPGDSPSLKETSDALHEIFQQAYKEAHPIQISSITHSFNDGCGHSILNFNIPVFDSSKRGDVIMAFTRMVEERKAEEDALPFLKNSRVFCSTGKQGNTALIIANPEDDERDIDRLRLHNIIA